jgi:integrase
MRRITKSTVDALEVGEIVSDSDLPGFRARRGKTHTVYSVQRRVGHKVITRTIGKHGIYTPDSARKQAQLLLLSLAQGEDPHAKKRREANLRDLTFGKLVELYLSTRRIGERTKKDVRNEVGKHLAPWTDKHANEITRSMVVEQYGKLKEHGETQAARVFRYAQAIFNHAIALHKDDSTGESDVRQNPIVVLKELKMLPKPKRRKTYIKSSQLKAWLDALEKTRAKYPMFCDYVLFGLFTGCRRSESAGLKWADVDLIDQTVIFRNTKNQSDFHLPTGDYLTELLRKRKAVAAEGSEYVFASTRGNGPVVDPRDAMVAITALSGVSFTLHDLRRTFTTIAEGLEISGYTLKRLLNHSLDDSDVTAGYVVSSVERLRGAMQRIENIILQTWRAK